MGKQMKQPKDLRNFTFGEFTLSYDRSHQIDDIQPRTYKDKEVLSAVRGVPVMYSIDSLEKRMNQINSSLF